MIVSVVFMLVFEQFWFISSRACSAINILIIGMNVML